MCLPLDRTPEENRWDLRESDSLARGVAPESDAKFPVVAVTELTQEILPAGQKPIVNSRPFDKASGSGA